MKFTARELVTLEEALLGMTQTPEVQKLLMRVGREKPRQKRHVIPNDKKIADHVDGYDRDDLGHSNDY